jgi:crotonobetainyl-CoA:carnitine CoA-transferase CaiB-like acyl-CoA transferase
MGAEKLTGIRVLEVAEYAVAPSAGAVLADWGADVIKVEHATVAMPSAGYDTTAWRRTLTRSTSSSIRSIAANGRSASTWRQLRVERS